MDITRAGKFVARMPATDATHGAAVQPIQIVVNWFEELRTKVPLSGSQLAADYIVERTARQPFHAYARHACSGDPYRLALSEKYLQISDTEYVAAITWYRGSTDAASGLRPSVPLASDAPDE
jgi:hypothetical protein